MYISLDILNYCIAGYLPLDTLHVLTKMDEYWRSILEREINNRSSTLESMKYAISHDDVDLYEHLLDHCDDELFHEDLRRRHPNCSYCPLHQCRTKRTIAYTVLSIEHNARKIIKKHTIKMDFMEAYAHTLDRKFDLNVAVVEDPEFTQLCSIYCT